ISVKKENGKRFFKIQAEKENFQAAAVILAAGSKAAPKSGSDGSGYALARKLGHTIRPVLPALVQLRCREKSYKQLAGIRTQAKITLYLDGETADTDTGELLFTEYGISGIPVFQVSRFASLGLARKCAVYAVL
ncbi:MAG TPA: aminoacetone oxidase family FAD-binding enzyme, partial [Lachnospiraceae bacterium]|nr:aminoacetone oxidase family FAD-binding enzyme [Lachnospiraceae bacterium]